MEAFTDSKVRKIVMVAASQVGKSELELNVIGYIIDQDPGSITNKINAAKSAVSNAIGSIKSDFNFSWKLPDLKLPHISVSGGKAPFGIGDAGSLPSFNIKWYKNGGILTEPTIFGTAGNNLLAGGEARDEAVLPLKVLWENMETIIRAILRSE